MAIVAGMVKDGTFIADDSKKPCKLSQASIMEIWAQKELIDLTRYEGKKIMVSYKWRDDGWLYSAEINKIIN